VPIYLQTSVWGGLTTSSLPISTVPLHGITALANCLFALFGICVRKR